ncbi:MAG TPA: hypothetical protein VL633_07895 [Bacteroidota bacterium]|jgi:hypothetical protein|nr:hypothetical protein [Bacteroidota bacterium]
MIVTVLAVAFLIVIGFIVVVGYKAIFKGGPSPEEIDVEKCSVCRRKFTRNELLLRTIGDYKLLYFCRECVLKLYADLGMKN